MGWITGSYGITTNINLLSAQLASLSGTTVSITATDSAGSSVIPFQFINSGKVPTTNNLPIFQYQVTLQNGYVVYPFSIQSESSGNGITMYFGSTNDAWNCYVNLVSGTANIFSIDTGIGGVSNDNFIGFRQNGATKMQAGCDTSYNFVVINSSGTTIFTVTPSGIAKLAGVATTAGAATTVSVGASPYTYTNSSVSNQQIFVQGGTVSAISFNPNGGTGIALSGLTDNVITLRPNDTLTITYTAAPTVNTIQL